MNKKDMELVVTDTLTVFTRLLEHLEKHEKDEAEELIHQAIRGLNKIKKDKNIKDYYSDEKI